MAEDGNSIEVCATLSTEYTLEKSISITLETKDGTGESHMPLLIHVKSARATMQIVNLNPVAIANLRRKLYKYLNKAILNIVLNVVATDARNDYDAVPATTLEFPASSGNDVTQCITVTITDDMLIECNETFTVSLALLNSAANLNTGNTETTVTITDSDSKWFPNQEVCIQIYLFPGAVISVPMTMPTDEAAGSVSVCATLTTTPANAELAKSITVSFSITGSTGSYPTLLFDYCSSKYPFIASISKWLLLSSYL